MTREAGKEEGGREAHASSQPSPALLDLAHVLQSKNSLPLTTDSKQTERVTLFAGRSLYRKCKQRVTDDVINGDVSRAVP
jgi:hypothetical protein